MTATFLDWLVGWVKATPTHFTVFCAVTLAAYLSLLVVLACLVWRVVGRRSWSAVCSWLAPVVLAVRLGVWSVSARVRARRLRPVPVHCYHAPQSHCPDRPVAPLEHRVPQHVPAAALPHVALAEAFDAIDLLLADDWPTFPAREDLAPQPATDLFGGPAAIDFDRQAEEVITKATRFTREAAEGWSR